MECDASLSSLLCLENEIFLEEKQELIDENHNAGGYDEDYVKMLFDREKNINEHLVLSNYLKDARLEAISWILKARATFGFRFQTVCLSMRYFDRFLSRRPPIGIENLWLKQLLPIASLLLAAKMEEKNVPALSQFKTKYSFEINEILRMELLVLNTLEWRMDPITPFIFLRFFIKEMWKKSQPPDHMLSSIIQLIFSSMKEISMFEHRPSVIAFASIFWAISPRLRRVHFECRMHSISFREFLEIDDVFACYELMQRVEISKYINSPDSRSAIETLDGSSNSGATIGSEQK